MKQDVANSLALIYHSLLRLYPARFRDEFGAEMTDVFRRRVEDAAVRSRWAVTAVCLRELRDAPHGLVDAHRYDWLEKWQMRIQLLRTATSTAGLPPPPPDGRDSWRQLGLELSLFLMAGLLLVGVTYLPFDGPGPGWQHDLVLLGRAITPLTLPLFLMGLARGLPRWAYPFGGLLLAYQALRANQAGLWPFLAVMLLAYAILAVTAFATKPHRSPLPAPLRRIGQSVALDWTRLSFGGYGATPLVIIFAFDDAHANNRTPYFALSILVMVAGALLYCRSRQSKTQISSLLGGMTLSLWMAWLDEAAFAGGLRDWIAKPYPGSEEVVWLLALWIPWLALILAPALLGSAGRAVKSKRTV